jgi:hypothetical protein
MVACMGRHWGKTACMTEVLVNYPGGALAGVDGKGRKGLPTAWYAPNESYFQKVFQGIASAYAPVIRRACTAPRPYMIRPELMPGVATGQTWLYLSRKGS